MRSVYIKNTSRVPVQLLDKVINPGAYVEFPREDWPRLRADRDTQDRLVNGTFQIVNGQGQKCLDTAAWVRSTLTQHSDRQRTLEGLLGNPARELFSPAGGFNSTRRQPSVRPFPTPSTRRPRTPAKAKTEAKTKAACAWCGSTAPGDVCACGRPRGWTRTAPPAWTPAECRGIRAAIRKRRTEGPVWRLAGAIPNLDNLWLSAYARVYALSGLTDTASKAERAAWLEVGALLNASAA